MILVETNFDNPLKLGVQLNLNSGAAAPPAKFVAEIDQFVSPNGPIGVQLAIVLNGS